MRVGVVGTNWGLMHVGAFRGAGAEVVGLCGHDLARTREAARREGIALATTDVGELAAAADVVVVAGPDGLHCEHALRALGAGAHVLCEKPIARTRDEAEAVAREAEARAPGQAFGLSFALRMLPPLGRLRAWLEGRPPVRSVQAQLRSGFVRPEPAAEGAPLMGASGDFGGASHLVDAALWLAGDEPAWVQASLTGRPAHDVGLLVGTARGARLHLSHVAAARPSNHCAWGLAGEGWEARFSAGYEPALGGWVVGPVEAFVANERGELGWHEIAPALGPSPGAREPWAEAHVGVARAFLARARGEASAPLATARDGLLVQRVFDAAMRSELSGRRVRLDEAEAGG
ncbi:MAG TPA: Gfo/Idh/MocA family oxidoreductase [Polyangiaceae bacterium]|nr:Gfo/Idh/MocA family oxidoreductase [Polyangiaceae bacterium]